MSDERVLLSDLITSFYPLTFSDFSFFILSFHVIFHYFVSHLYVFFFFFFTSHFPLDPLGYSYTSKCFMCHCDHCYLLISFIFLRILLFVNILSGDYRI